VNAPNPDWPKLVLIGGGLSNSLIALRLLARGFDDFVLIDSGNLLKQDQTWSFHESDLTPEQWEWVRPLVGKTWPTHEVRFPGYRRELASPYHSIQADAFREFLLKTIPARCLRLHTRVARVLSWEVQLDNGATIQPSGIIDGRGIDHSTLEPCGYQKFVGLDLRFRNPHGLAGPILKDATVPQIDGYRFLYSLPWDDRTILVEDTRYSIRPDIDAAEYEREILAYAERTFGPVETVLRREAASLAIPLTRNMFQGWREQPGVPLVGLRGGFFHPTTGYSFCLAVRIADRIANLKTRAETGLDTASLYKILDGERQIWEKQAGFYLFLNRMLFGAALPEKRFRIFSRFYRLSEPVIHRFYSGRSTGRDRARLLIGRPPVPVGRALKSIFSDSWLTQTKELEQK
jgi:lycopene beta-cyclase